MANRRDVLIGSGAAAIAAAAGISGSFLFGSSAALAQQFDAAKLLAPASAVPPDHPLGPKDAKVTIVEYLSPSCPHCKAFLEQTFPQVKTEYIDTNKIQFIPRPFIRNVLDAVVFMLAEAAGEAQYHNVVDTYFKTQDQWVTSKTPNDTLFQIAQQFGFTQETYDAALKNQDIFNGLTAIQKQAVDEFKLEGTPTFYINGKMMTGEASFEAIKAEIDPLLG